MLEPSIRLRQAIVDGNLLVVKRLLKRFPDLLENLDPENGWSSLHYAAFGGRYLICVHLISLGHDRNEISRTFKGNTSVHLALLNGHEQTTHLLLQHFPKELDMTGQDSERPIHVSVKKDFFKCVEMLLGLGAQIQAVDDEENNALHFAMKYGSLQCIKVLVQHGINTNLKNKHGLKPIDVASSFMAERYLTGVINNSNSGDNNEETSSSQLSLKDITVSRVHSNSLPPLPSVTTARRSSISSTHTTTTRSPVPRTAISLGFTGSNSSSYMYSPAVHGAQSHSPSGLNIKPPGLTLASPVLYSPSSATTPGLIPSIREEDSSHIMSSHSLSSFPSMSSISSQMTTTPDIESRTRANSQLPSPVQQQQQQLTNISFQRVVKSRSNSHGSRTRSSPPDSTASSLNLSRTSTHSDGSLDRRTPILNVPIVGRTRRE